MTAAKPYNPLPLWPAIVLPAIGVALGALGWVLRVVDEALVELED